MTMRQRAEAFAKTLAGANLRADDPAVLLAFAEAEVRAAVRDERKEAVDYLDANLPREEGLDRVVIAVDTGAHRNPDPLAPEPEKSRSPPPGCLIHWEERNRELAAEGHALRVALDAANANICALAEKNEQLRAELATAEDHKAMLSTTVTALSEGRDRLRAERDAAAGLLRRWYSVFGGPARVADERREDVICTACGSGHDWDGSGEADADECISEATRALITRTAPAKEPSE